MCFGGLRLNMKPYRYVSQFTSPKPQTHYHIRKDLNSNYHFWNIDDEGNIVDASPEPMGPNPSRIEDKRVYIPWSSDEQQKVINRFLNEQAEMEHISIEEVKECLDEDANFFYEEPQFRSCLKNSWAVRKIKGYRMVCGSMGYVIGEEPSYKVVALDWGY